MYSVDQVDGKTRQAINRGPLYSDLAFKHAALPASKHKNKMK